MRDRLVEEGPRLRPHINVFVDGFPADLDDAGRPGRDGPRHPGGLRGLTEMIRRRGGGSAADRTERFGRRRLSRQTSRMRLGPNIVTDLPRIMGRRPRDRMVGYGRPRGGRLPSIGNPNVHPAWRRPRRRAMVPPGDPSHDRPGTRGRHRPADRDRRLRRRRTGRRPSARSSSASSSSCSSRATVDAAAVVEADGEQAARDGLLPEQLIDRYLSTLWALWEMRGGRRPRSRGADVARGPPAAGRGRARRRRRGGLSLGRARADRPQRRGAAGVPRRAVRDRLGRQRRDRPAAPDERPQRPRGVGVVPARRDRRADHG